MNILITGASGNIGRQIIAALPEKAGHAYLKSIRKEKKPGSDECFFDFSEPLKSIEALQKIDVLFLLRPPHISNVKRDILPILEGAKKVGVKHIVFLSVQGAENISFIPHARIEKAILELGFDFTFIRPSYFMQNLTTMFKNDLCKNDRIYIPSGQAKFLWVDAVDLGQAIARVLESPSEHRNKAYTLTGTELASMSDVAALLSAELKRPIHHVSPNLVSFWFNMRKEGISRGKVVVMIALHFLPRMQSPPAISSDIENLLKRKPATLAEFVKREASQWAR